MFCGKVHLPTFLQQKLEAKKGNIVEIKEIKSYREIANGLPANDASDDTLASFAAPFKYSPASGEIIGLHNGAHFFTIGQRKGMNVGGHKEALFVIDTDVVENLVYVGEGQEHPGLNRKGLFIKKEEVHWIRTDLRMEDGESRDYW